MSRRPPRTAAGYLAPPEAQVRGWRCAAGCGLSDQAAPRSWPHPCPGCGQPTEPTFEEPWAHEARGFELRRDVASADEYRRAGAETALLAWTYADARRRGDDPAAAAAWQAARDDLLRAGAGHSPWEIVRAATECDDLDRAIGLLLEWYPTIDTSDVANDSARRAAARNFVSLCIGVLEREASIGRAGEAALDAAMREMHDRHEDIPVANHRPGTWAQFRELASRHTVWHLACHASADPNSIMDSRLVFTDRAVALEELRRTLPAGARRLAVLSACQTNITGCGDAQREVGLPSAFLELGFAGVIASAWPVDDLATTYLMTALHHWWRRDGNEPVVALNRAQRWLRTATGADLVATLPGLEPEGDGTSEHPYGDARYWAPFAYTGI